MHCDGTISGSAKSVLKRDAFVIMPFSPTPSCKDWTEVYEHVFKPTLVDLGWACERATPDTGSLIASIVDKLSSATVVLADVTDRNANVFYELGVRHSLSVRTIMVSQNTDHVPSDLKGYWHTKYGLAPAQVTKFKMDLKRILENIEGNPEKNDNPIADYLASRNHSLIAVENKLNIKRLNALITEIQWNVIEVRELQQPLTAHVAPLLNLTAISMLLDTYYVDLGRNSLKLAYEFRRRLAMIAQGTRDSAVLRETILFAAQFTTAIEKARDEIQKGVFAEPPIPSFMQWQHRPLERNTLTCAFCSEIFEKGSTSAAADKLACPKCGKLHAVDAPFCEVDLATLETGQIRRKARRSRKKAAPTIKRTGCL